MDYSFPSPDSIVVIGIDVGQVNTGIAILIDGNLTHDTIINDSREAPVQAVRMATLIHEYVVSHVPDNRKVMFIAEDYAFARGHYNMIQPETAGVIKDRVLHNTHLYHGILFIAPNSIKKIFAGSGKATKSEMKKSAKKEGFKVKTSHEADAIGAVYAYKALYAAPTEAMISRSIITEETDVRNIG